MRATALLACLHWSLLAAWLVPVVAIAGTHVHNSSTTITVVCTDPTDCTRDVQRALDDTTA